MLAPLVVAVVAALGLAQPALAEPYWQPVNTDGSWHCDKTTETVKPLVYYQGCTVVSGHYLQTVLVVSNTSGSAVTMDWGAVSNDFGNWTCTRSVLSAGQRTGCFSPTHYVACGVTVHGQAAVVFGPEENLTPTPARSVC